MEAREGNIANSCKNEPNNLYIDESLGHITKWTSISDIIAAMESLLTLERKDAGVTSSKKSKNNVCRPLADDSCKLEEVFRKISEELKEKEGDHYRCERLREVLEATRDLTTSTWNYNNGKKTKCDENNKTALKDVVRAGA